MRQRVVVSLIVRNEADRHLRRTLECARIVAKSTDGCIRVVDDASDDETVAICQEYGAVILTSIDPQWAAHEGRARQRLYRFTSSLCGPGDWVLALDADETVNEPERVGDVVERAVAAGCAAISLPLYEFWTPTKYRVDGFWFGTNVARLYAWQSGGMIADRPLACGSVPTYVKSAATFEQDEIRLLHWGYIREEDRARKHAFYAERGGHGARHVASIVAPSPLLKDYA